MSNFSQLKAWRASSVITLGIAGLFFGLVNSGSHAQQEPSRQLVQTNEQRPNVVRRIALVIGNGAYTNAPPLKNPPNDARDMAATLKALGFEVISGININQREMKRLLREFGQKLKSGGSGLFYYAGHGVQSKGRNYLIPIDADIQSEIEAEDAAVDVGLLLGYMDDAQNSLNIVILDACRNNPFARSFRSASSGLAQVDAPTGTLIAYATAPGRVAADGAGANGLYTSELLKAMRLPGLSATDMFMQVRAEVMKRTGNKQVPWEASSLVGSFYFSGSPTNSTASSVGAGNPSPSETRFDAAAFEYSYWETIKNSSNPDDFKAYLEKYPAGQFITLANNRIKTLEGSKSSETPPKSGADGATELAFWDAVKTSQNADDFRAYLKKFPNGTFADLASNRLKVLENEEASKLNADENVKRTRVFKGVYNTLIVSPAKIEFVTNISRQLLECSSFDKARLDSSKEVITDFSCPEYGSCRFSGITVGQAATALDYIHEVCKPPAQSTPTDASRSGSLVATITKTFKIDWGFRGAGVDLFFNGNLLIWDKKFQLEVDQIDWQRFSKDPQEGQRSADHYRGASQHMDCRAFKLARVDDFWIREIKYDSMSYRLRFHSAAEAVDALAEIQRICRANP